MIFKTGILLPLLISSSVIYVVEVSREGARAPLEFMPWDNLQRWPQGPGKLSPAGMRQHYLIGSELRNRYIKNTKLLSPTLYIPEISIFSTDYDRTLVSATSQLQGLYPPGSGPVLKNSFQVSNSVPPINVTNELQIINSLGYSALPNSTQMIAIHSDSIQREVLLLPAESCPRYEYLIQVRNSSLDVNQLVVDNNYLYKTVQSYFKCTYEYAIYIFPMLMDSLRANNFHRYSIPTQFSGNFYEEANSYYNLYIQKIYYYPDALARYAGSAFLANLINEFIDAKNQNNEVGFSYYSGHDASILNILAGLQLDVNFEPPFASTLIFQLITQDNEYFVTLNYNDEPLIIDTCGAYMCPFYKFIRYLELRSLQNTTISCVLNSTEISWEVVNPPEEEEFSFTGNEDEGKIKWFGWFSAVYLGLVIFVIVIILVVWRITAKKPKRRIQPYAELDIDGI